MHFNSIAEEAQCPSEEVFVEPIEPSVLVNVISTQISSPDKSV